MAGQRRELLTVSQLVHGGGGGELEKHVIRHLCQICCVRSISQSACAKSAAIFHPLWRHIVGFLRSITIE